MRPRGLHRVQQEAWLIGLVLNLKQLPKKTSEGKEFSRITLSAIWQAIGHQGRDRIGHDGDARGENFASHSCQHWHSRQTGSRPIDP
jgi:hypothetical protein